MNNYSVKSYPDGDFYQMDRMSGNLTKVTAQDVYAALVADGADNPPALFATLVDFGVTNWGRVGIDGGRLFLFVPAGVNPLSRRGVSSGARIV